MQLFREKDNRPAIIFRFADNSFLNGLENTLNESSYQSLSLKKNETEFAFFITITDRAIVDIRASYDEERYVFVVNEASQIDSLEKSDIELDKADYIVESLQFAFKREGWRYSNPSGLQATEALFERLNELNNYDATIIELQRQEEIRLREEEENKNAKKQITVWTKYVKKELELLDGANKPFALASSSPEIKKSWVSIEVLPSISTRADSTLLEDISQEIGGKVADDQLEMTLEEFFKWQQSENEINAEIIGRITMRLNVSCIGYWKAKAFKEENKYGREFYYGHYNSETSSIELTYKASSVKDVRDFFKNVNNSFEFNGSVLPSMVKLSFPLKVTIAESDEERRKRIDILSGRDLYSDSNMKGVYLGTLSKVGSDKKHIRIILPKEKEEKQKAKDYFKSNGIGMIHPGLLKDRVLLLRELDALNKLDKPQNLQNTSLKEFILNSCRAQPTEEFVGLSSEMLVATPQYVDCLKSQMLSLNPSQQEAVVKGLYAKDLCLLQGPPGTGKTTVISELIWQHIRKNQQVRIMLTSQTNLAIDNALNRLFSNSAVIVGSAAWRNMMLIKPIRKADSEKIEEEGLPFSIERIDEWIAGKEETKSSNNIVNRWMNHIVQRVSNNDEYSDILDEWKTSLMHPSAGLRKTFASQYKKDSNVLCMTCGKVDSADFRTYESGKGFDVVIVDEASKATLPELLMPLCYARKSIIIGDHRQLPPVIFEDDFFKKIKEIDPELEAELDKQFKHDLVDESLFKRLITHPYLSPTLKSTFNVQYRMHPDINAVISQFYAEDAGGLTCGLDKTKVDVADLSENNSRYHGLSLGRFVQPNVHTIWVDVPDGMEQGGEGTSSFNELEIEAVKLVIEALCKAEGFRQYMNFWANYPNIEARITESKIGVISFYAAQVQKIRSSIQSFCDRENIKVTTKSVDKFQGQESGIVIVSTVRTKKLGFTRTPERLNVALSRARRLLIIVGNSKFYSSDRAKTEKGQYIYRNVIDIIKDSSNNDVFIDYRELKTILGY